MSCRAGVCLRAAGRPTPTGSPLTAADRLFLVDRASTRNFTSCRIHSSPTHLVRQQPPGAAADARTARGTAQFLTRAPIRQHGLDLQSLSNAGEATNLVPRLYPGPGSRSDGLPAKGGTRLHDRSVADPLARLACGCRPFWHRLEAGAAETPEVLPGQAAFAQPVQGGRHDRDARVVRRVVRGTPCQCRPVRPATPAISPTAGTAVPAAPTSTTDPRHGL